MKTLKDQKIEIKRQVNLVDIIKSNINLKKVGSNYKACCPFHSEKEPSFIVSEDKQIYHCFGCGETGDVFAFLMKFKNMTFFEALKEVAESINYKLELDEKEDKLNEEKNNLYEINKYATSHFYNSLKSSQNSINYLKSRNIKGNSAKLFEIGYNDNSIVNDILNKFSIDNLIKSDIIKKYNENIYSNFQNKLIFPIKDEFDRILGFGSRVLDNSLPKYINSRESIIFKKGQILYGLDKACKEIKQKDYAIITEGYFDTITLHQEGFRNVVAVLGTTLTKEHIIKLKRYTNNIVLCFDDDKAGLIATEKAIKVCLENYINCYILTLPKDYDPSDYILKFGAAEFNKLIEKKQDGLKYYIESKFKDIKLNDNIEIKLVVKEIYKFLSNINDEIIIELGLKLLAEITRLNFNTLQREYNKQFGNIRNNTKSINKKESKQSKEIVKDFNYIIYKIERWILYIIIFNYAAFKEDKSLFIRNIKFKNEDTINIYKLLEEYLNKDLDLDLNELLEEIKDENFKNELITFSIEKNPFVGDAEQFINKAFYKYKLCLISNKKNNIKQEICKLEEKIFNKEYKDKEELNLIKLKIDEYFNLYIDFNNKEISLKK